MLDGLRQFIADIVSPDVQSRAFDEADYRLAATALLIHVVSLDGEPSSVEKRKLHSLIETRFKLDSGTADHLIALASRVPREVWNIERDGGPESDNSRERRNKEAEKVTEILKFRGRREHGAEATGFAPRPEKQRQPDQEQERRRDAL